MNKSHAKEAKKRRIQDLLRTTSLFTGISRSSLERLALGSVKICAARNEMITHRGTPNDGVYSVIYGHVKLSYRARSGGLERVLRLIGPGESFGEAMMFIKRDNEMAAQALSDSLLLHTNREAVLATLDDDPQLTRNLLIDLSRWVYMLTGDIAAITTRSALQRVIGFLFRSAHVEEGCPFRIAINKDIIASRLNVTPEHFSRILLDLKQRELIRVQGREFTILNVQGLRNYHG